MLVCVQFFLPEHSGGWVISNIETHANTAMEQFNCQMVLITMIENNTRSLLGLEHNCEVQSSVSEERV